MIKVMIIEDEPEIRKLLHKMIERQDGFTVVSESSSFTEAVTEFTKYRPEVAFVDIDLNGESGLECAKVLTEFNPQLKVVFATAHSEYMANAFEIYAFDYLVKPFDMERLNRTLERIRQGLSTEEESHETISTITAALPEQYRDKLLIKGKEQMIFVDKNDIIFIERSASATNITTTEEVYTTSVSLHDLEEKLSPAEFMRCHKSYIINLSRITRIEPYGRWTYIVRLKGTENTALMTSQNYDEIKKMFR